MDRSKSSVLYQINDVPPWYLCILLGLQHCLVMVTIFVIPIIISRAICAGEDYQVQTELTGTILFMSGLITLLQTTFGTRLPIVQGGTFAFITPTIALLKLDQWKCPSAGSHSDSTLQNASWTTFNSTTVSSLNNTEQPYVSTEVWQSRIREVQGAIVVASCLEVFIGLSGLVGVLLRFIGPLTIAPTVMLIGMGLFDTVSNYASGQWWIAIMTIVLITIFSQYLKRLKLPFCAYSAKKKCYMTKFPIFTLFPIFLGICMSWLICYILTETDTLPKKGWGFKARTDSKSSALYTAHWFRFPYPGQWGTPTVSAAGVLGMLAAVVASVIESIGDYYACAKISGAPQPPAHAINRGIGIEGLGCILAGVWGTGNGTTSYSQNIGAIAVTGVASRRVVQVAGLILVILGLIGKFGALFVTIPDPVIGGTLMVTFGMITAVGMSNLQYVDLNSPRNLYVVGFSVMLGLTVPYFLDENPGVISTGSKIADQILTVLLSTGMLIGGVTAFILDNTIPGTLEERGMLHWRKDKIPNREENINGQSCYNFPFGMKYLRKWKWTKYIPICPTFNGYNVSCRKRNTSQNVELRAAYTIKTDN